MIIIVCFAFSASARTVPSYGYCGEEISYTYNSATKKLVIGGVGDLDYGIYGNSPFRESEVETVVINSGITSIGEHVFFDCENLKEVSLPNTLTCIESNAFSGCSSLTEIVIPDSVTAIGSNAFFGCSALESVVLPEYISEIEKGLFCECTSLSDITIPKSVTRIGNFAFYDCDSLENIIIGNNITIIDKQAFAYCDGLKSLTIGENVTYIGEEAFSYCKNLEELTIPDKVESIGAYAFRDCTSLKTATIGKGVNSMGKSVFHCCLTLSGITVDEKNQYFSSDKYGVLFDKNKTRIVHYPSGNKQTSYIVPDTVTTIGEYAFYPCDYLKGIVIPYSVISIEYRACDFSKDFDVYYTESELYWNSINIDESNFTLLNYVTVHYNYSLDVVGKPSTISATQSTSSVKLTWSEVEYATIYRVYQKNASGWKRLGEVSKLNGTIKKLTPGTKYTFAVKAGKIIGGKTIWSKSYITIDTATKPEAPKKVSAIQNINLIRLKWSGSSEVDGYKIFYKKGSSWKAYGYTLATYMDFGNLKAGSKYIFAIQPYIRTTSGVVWGEYAEFVAATTPSTVTAKVTSPSKGKITITWNEVAGADGYQVYYKVGNGSYKLYKIYSGSKNLTFSNLKSGTKYTFAVRAGIRTSGGNIYGAYKAASATVK